MNLYRLTQRVNESPAAYRVAVVTAPSPEQARLVHPGGPFYQDGMSSGVPWHEGAHHSGIPGVDRSGFWAKPQYVSVTLLGLVMDDLPGLAVVCARRAEHSEREVTFAQERSWREHRRERLQKIADDFARDPDALDVDTIP